MTKTLNQLLRPFVPNVPLRIRHVEPETTLEVRFREHLGLIARGARAYEPRYVAVLRTLLDSGDRVFDVGANIGFYSVLFSRWVGLTGKVIAYEPDSMNVTLLRRNLESNRCENTIVRDIALSNKAGEDQFSLDTVTRSTGHLGPGPTYAETIFGNAKETAVTVNTGTLDDEAELWGPPNLIKLDIEGGEFDVLSGGVGLLDCDGPLVVSELNTWNEDQSPGSTRASRATELLCDHGYLLWNLDDGSRVRTGDAPWMVLGARSDRVGEPPVVRALEKLAA
jgi:FkbM family methyltransferase